jgi:hypothetical protein
MDHYNCEPNRKKSKSDCELYNPSKRIKLDNNDGDKRKNNVAGQGPSKRLKTDKDIMKLMLKGKNGVKDDVKDGGSDDGSDEDYVDGKSKCNNPLCDHKLLGKDLIVGMPSKINSIDDLIILGKSYHCKRNKIYNGLNLKILCNLVVPLTKLKNMIGMASVKENILSQIIFFLQGLDKKEKCNECLDCICGKPCTKKTDGSMKNICLYGSPGIGKTELSKIMGEIYNSMGIIQGDGYVVARRNDLIGQFLGSTAKKTSDFLNATLPKKLPNRKMSKQKIIIIDEVYSLSSGKSVHAGGGDHDMYSKECIDTINQWISEHENSLIIVCGYKEDVAACFFAVNQGLERRFPFRYEIDPYTAKELMEIFLLKVKKCNWSINVSRDELELFFNDKAGHFPNYGGDIENLLLKCKIVHGYRVVYLKDEKKILNMQDIVNGFEMFQKHKAPKDSDDIDLNYDGIYTF